MVISPTQWQGDGPNPAVINGNNNQQMRGVARVQGDFERANLKTLVGNGYVVMPLPRAGEPGIQGVVGLEGDTLAACLEDYFRRFLNSCRRVCLFAPAT